jgi:type III secretion protein T
MQTIAKLAAPMLLVLLLIDFGANLASKAAQKLDLSSLSQPIKGAVTVMMLAIFAGLFVHQVEDQLDLRLFREQLRAIAQDGQHPAAALPRPPDAKRPSGQ